MEHAENVTSVYRVKQPERSEEVKRVYIKKDSYTDHFFSLGGSLKDFTNHRFYPVILRILGFLENASSLAP